MKIMRRKDKMIDTDAAVELLTKCEYGILSTADSEGRPYGVPLNYLYKDNCIYFHSASAGHKIENISCNCNVSFCAVGDTKVIPSLFTTAYESVVVFGVASEVQGAEKYDALLGLMEKYAPDHVAQGKAYIKTHDSVTKVIKIRIKHISGKISPAKSTQ